MPFDPQQNPWLLMSQRPPPAPSPLHQALAQTGATSPFQLREALGLSGAGGGMPMDAGMDLAAFTGTQVPQGPGVGQRAPGASMLPPGSPPIPAEAFAGAPAAGLPPAGGGVPPGDELAAAQTAIEDQARSGAPVDQLPPSSPLTLPTGDAQRSAAAGQNVPRGTQGRQGVEGKEKTSSTIQELIQGLNKRELKALEAQGLTVDKLKKSLAELEGRDLPVDLTGLASLTDAWTGSNFSQTYRPEETRRERTGAVEKLRGQITAAEQGMTESELAMLKNQLATQFQLDDRAWREKRAAIDDKFTKEKLAIDWAQLDVARAKASQEKLGNKMAAWDMRKDIEKLDTTKAIRGNIDLAVALNNYEKLVDKHAKSPGGVPAAELDNAYSAITLAYKNAGELGALSGPDMGIVEQGVGRAGGLGNWLKTEFKGGAPGIKKQIGHMRNATKAGFDRRFASMKEMTSGYEPLVSDYVGEFGRQMDEAVGRAPIDEQAAARAWVNDPKNAKDPRLPKIRASLSGGQ